MIVDRAMAMIPWKDIPDGGELTRLAAETGSSLEALTRAYCYGYLRGLMAYQRMTNGGTLQ